MAKLPLDSSRKRRLDQPLERGRARRPTYDPEFFGAMSERVARLHRVMGLYRLDDGGCCLLGKLECAGFG